MTSRRLIRLGPIIGDLAIKGKLEVDPVKLSMPTLLNRTFRDG